MITLLYFGQIRSITTLPREQLEYVSNLDELKMILLEKYPKLMNAHFAFSVNKVISENCRLKENDEVALMPPFSGG